MYEGKTLAYFCNTLTYYRNGGNTWKPEKIRQPSNTIDAYPAHDSETPVVEDQQEVWICKSGVSICVMLKSISA